MAEDEFDFDRANIDPDKIEEIELDFALDTVVKLYKGLRKKGLSKEDASSLTVEFLRKSMDDG